MLIPDPDAAQGSLDLFECWCEISYQLSSSAGKVHSAVPSLEKADPKVVFKSADGVADAGLGHA